MERSEILAAMGELKLFGMRSAFDGIVAAAVKRQHEPQRVIGDLVSAEIAEKQARSIKYQMTVAKLPLAKDVDDFRFEGIRRRSGVPFPSRLTPHPGQASRDLAQGRAGTPPDPRRLRGAGQQDGAHRLGALDQGRHTPRSGFSAACRRVGRRGDPAGHRRSRRAVRAKVA